MVKGKRIRDKGKIRLSRYFKGFSEGETVAIVPEAGVKASFPKRLKGLSGTISGSRGNYKIIKLKEGNKTKQFIIHPVHLKKI